MGRTVDHDARRDEVGNVALELIAQGGVDAATVREIANVGGFSTKVVTRYFADKRELLLFVYRLGAKRARARLRAIRAESPADVLACAAALLPLDEERRAESAVWLAFWGMAISDRDFALEQRRRVRSARQLLVAVIESAVAAGALDDRIDPRELASELLVAVHGVSVQAMFDPSEWPPERQRSFLAHRLGNSAK